MNSPCVRIERDGALLFLVLNNPSRMNALNSKMWKSIPDLVADAERDDDVRVVVVKGAGERAFSAGADISEFSSLRSGELAEAYDASNHAAFESLRLCEKPTVALIRGYCLGGGLLLALQCDLRIAADDASFSIPMAKLGVGYDPRWVAPMFSVMSPSRAKEMLFTGRRFSGAEALSMGLVNALHPAANIDVETRKLMNEIASNAPLSLRLAKQMVNAFSAGSEPHDLERLVTMAKACIQSEDYAEGQAAFREKRTPTFRGR